MSIYNPYHPKPRSNKLPYISYHDCAEELNCSLRHVQRIVKRRGIEVRYFGAKPMLLIDDIIEELEKNKKPIPLNEK